MESPLGGDGIDCATVGIRMVRQREQLTDRAQVQSQLTAVADEAQTIHRVEVVATVAAARSAPSTHWLLREAVAQFVEREEKREAFRHAGLQARAEYQASGQHINHNEADAWLARLEAGEEVEAPECHG